MLAKRVHLLQSLKCRVLTKIKNNLKNYIMKRYLNIKTVYGVETVDELDSKDFSTFKEFKAELRRLASEYHTSGMNVYSSQRCDKTWNKND